MSNSLNLGAAEALSSACEQERLLQRLVIFDPLAATVKWCLELFCREDFDCLPKVPNRRKRKKMRY